jgi:hypothetical protein
MSETDIDPDTLAAALEQLDPGTRIGDRIVLSKRQVIALAGSSLGVGALAQFGISEAEAQAAGSVGTSSSPVNVEGYDVVAANSIEDASGTSHTGELADESDTASSTSTNSGYELTVDGDTYEFNE